MTLLPLLLLACGPTKSDPIDLGEPDSAAQDSAEPGGDTDVDDPDDTGDTDPVDTEEPPGPVDDDGDGYTAEDGDCDDSDPDSNPEGDEGTDLDGVDQDCDGVADDVHVCEDDVYTTIQAALDDAPEGFTVLVCPGIYPENLNFSRSVVLQSMEGAPFTTILGDGTASVITVDGRYTVGIQGFTITGGHAEWGGGLMVKSATVDITGNFIEANTADLGGGGLAISNAKGTISGNLIDGNTALEGGGLYLSRSPVLVESNTISTNLATSTDEELYNGGSGGGGAFVSGSGDFVNNTIELNDSYYNGGGIFLLQASGTLSGNTFNENHCAADGAALYTNYSTSDVTDNIFNANASDDDGGGMRAYHGYHTITGNSFFANTAVDDGGGMKLSHSTNTVSDNYFEGNEAGDAGGGLEFDNETSDISDCTFVENKALRGGGMHGWRVEGRVTYESLTFLSNEATDCGGGLQVDNAPYGIFLHSSTFQYNTAVDGGAICVDKQYQDDELTVFESTSLRMENLVLWGNVASDDAGGIYSRLGNITIRNVTIHDGRGGEAGSLALKESTAAVINSIFSDDDGAYLVTLEEESTATFSYNNFFDNDGGFSGMEDPTDNDGNFYADPKMVDPEAGDFSLSSSSPCIDAGDPSVLDTDRSRSDIGKTGGPRGW